MKRTLLTCLILTALALSFFVSCNAETAVPEDGIAYIRFGENSRALSADATPVPYDELYWFYTATKADGYGTTGQTANDTVIAVVKDVEDGTIGPDSTTVKVPKKGLDGTIGPFSAGKWTFTLSAFKTLDTDQPEAGKFGEDYVSYTYSYKDGSGSEETVIYYLTDKIYTDDGNITATLRPGDTKTVAVTVEAVGDDGVLKFDAGNTKFVYESAQTQETKSEPLFKLVMTKTTKTDTEESYKTYTLTNDDTVSGRTAITLSAQTDKKTYLIAFASGDSLEMEKGTYICTAKAYLSGQEANPIKEQQFYLGIYSGEAVTTLTGDLTEAASSYVNFDVKETVIVRQTLTLAEDKTKSAAMSLSAEIAPVTKTAETDSKDDSTMNKVAADFAEGAVPVADVSDGSVVDLALALNVSKGSAGDNAFEIKSSDGSSVIASIDASLTKYVDGVDSGKITDFDQPVTVSIFIGKGLDDDYSVAYTGATDKTQPSEISYNKDTGILSFKTDHFSNFAIVKKGSMPAAMVEEADGTKKYYLTLEEAIAYSGEKSSITLLSNSDLTGAGGNEQICFERTGNLNLGSKTISGMIQIGGASESDPITSLVITGNASGSDYNVKSKYTWTDKGALLQPFAITLLKPGTVIKSGRYTSDNAVVTVKCQGVYDKDGNRDTSAANGKPRTSDLMPTVTIDDGEFVATGEGSAVYLDIGKAVINGGKFTTNSDIFYLSSGDSKQYNELIINDGEFIAEGNSAVILRNEDQSRSGDWYKKKVTINNGTFNGKLIEGASCELTFEIKGGTFSTDPSEYVVDGYVATPNTNENPTSWTVSKCNDHTYAWKKNSDNKYYQECERCHAKTEAKESAEVLSWDSLKEALEANVESIELVGKITTTMGKLPNSETAVEWRVLDVNEESKNVLLISEKVLEIKGLNSESKEYSWATSDIRTYLNGAGDDGFAKKYSLDLSKIASVTLKTEKSAEYKTLVDETSTDKIFLLSAHEAIPNGAGAPAGNGSELYGSGTYFSGSDYSDLLAEGLDDSGVVGWWTRTPSYIESYSDYGVAFIYFNDSYTCSILESSLSEYPSGAKIGIRPAFWLDLSTSN